MALLINSVESLKLYESSSAENTKDFFGILILTILA